MLACLRPKTNEQICKNKNPAGAAQEIFTKIFDLSAKKFLQRSSEGKQQDKRKPPLDFGRAEGRQ